MKLSRYIFISILFLLASCSKRVRLEDYANRDKLPQLKIIGLLNDYTKTRTHQTAWLPNDTIAVYGYGTVSSDFKNVPYSYSDNNRFSVVDKAVIFDGEDETLNVTAYCPYLHSDKMEGDCYVLNTLHQDSDSQDKLDLLASSTESATFSSPQVKFQFAHVMSKVLLTLKPGQGVTLSEIQDESTVVKISNLIHQAKFDLVNNWLITEGSVVQDNVAVDAVPVTKDGAVSYTLYLIPQVIESGDITFEFEVAGHYYHVDVHMPLMGNAEGVHGLQPSTFYNLVIRIDKTTATIVSDDINDWYVNDMGNIGIKFGDRGNDVVL